MVRRSTVCLCGMSAAAGALKLVLSAANATAILIKRAKRLKIKGIYFLYRLLQILALPLVLIYFLARGLRNRGYWHTFVQRLGFLPRSFRQAGPGAIWLHAVSVGEVLSSLEFLRQIRQRLPRSP